MSINKNNTLSVAQAFANIIIFAAISDGVFEEEEKDIVVNILSRMSIFKPYQDYLKPMVTNCVQSLITNKDETLSNAIAILPPQLSETAFAVASDIVMSDGKITEQEEDLLKTLVDKLSLDKEIANKISEVMTIKNKGQHFSL